MSNPIAVLQEIGRIFQKEENNFAELSKTIANFKNLVNELSTIDLENETTRKSLFLTNGKALGTTWAALCLDDVLRTKMFIKGVFKAIEKLQKKNTKPIHILYAGTGPYATLLLPVFASLTAEEVQATVIEINTESFENMKRLINKLGFDSHILSYENDDATTIRIKNPETIDIVLSETLQCGLIKEQQIPITYNLLQQVPENTILIPQSLALDICLLNYTRLKDRAENTPEESFCYVLERVIEISNKIHNQFQLELNTSNTQILAEKQIELPKDKMASYDNVALLTRITVFENEKIAINESGLTIPILLKKEIDLKTVQKFTIQYKIDAQPGYLITV